jgi:hypothetical protein
MITSNMNTLTQIEVERVVGGMMAVPTAPAGQMVPDVIVELWNRWLYQELFGAPGA